MTTTIDIQTASSPSDSSLSSAPSRAGTRDPHRAEAQASDGSDGIDFIERDELRAGLEGAQPPIVLEALPERYYRKAHLPGARLMPHDRVDELAASLIPARDSAVVVYCASETCRNSDQAAEALRRLGYASVRVYRGGKADWQAAGLPVEGG